MPPISPNNTAMNILVQGPSSLVGSFYFRKLESLDISSSFGAQIHLLIASPHPPSSTQRSHGALKPSGCLSGRSELVRMTLRSPRSFPFPGSGCGSSSSLPCLWAPCSPLTLITAWFARAMPGVNTSLSLLWDPRSYCQMLLAAFGSPGPPLTQLNLQSAQCLFSHLLL